MNSDAVSLVGFLFFSIFFTPVIVVCRGAKPLSVPPSSAFSIKLSSAFYTPVYIFVLFFCCCLSPRREASMIQGEQERARASESESVFLAFVCVSARVLQKRRACWATLIAHAQRGAPLIHH